MAYVQAQTQRIQIPFIGGAYEASSLPISAQESVNLYVEAGEGASNPVSLRGVPGASAAGSLTNIRAAKWVLDTLYVVSGDDFRKVNPDGSSEFLGNVVSDGKTAYIAFNIFEVVVLSAGNWYVYRDGTFSSVEAEPMTHADFIDGYILGVEIGTGRFRYSNINDAQTVDGADFATAEGSPDNTIGLIVDHREVFLFGTDSLERWYNDGVTPFVRVPGGYSERGCGAGNSPAKLDNTVFWLGNDYVVYRLTDGRPERVSNHGVEQLIERVPDPSLGVGLAYSLDGHSFYQITFPGELTITFDAATNLWHTRRQFGRKDCGYLHHAYAYNEHFIGGNRLWKLDDSNRFEGPLERVRTVGPIRTGRRTARMYGLTLLLETGSSLSEDQKIFLQISDDGGRTFSDRIEAKIGARGGYRQEVKFHGLGLMYDNETVFRLTLTDTANFSLVEAYADVG